MSKPGARRGRLSLRFRSDRFTCIKLAFSERYVRFHDSCKKKQTCSLLPQTVIRHRLFEAFNQRVLGNKFLFPEEGYIAGDGSNAPTADIAPAAKLSILRRHKVGNDRGFSRPSISSSDEILG